MKPVSRFALAAMTTLALLGAACGGSDRDTSTSEASGTCLAGSPDCQDTGGSPESPGPPLADDPGDGAFPVQAKPTISEPGGEVAFSAPQPWDEVRDDGDGRETTHWVTFTSAPAPCTIVDRVEVSETVFSVTIAVFTGPAAGSEETACPAVAEYRAVPIVLDAPIAGRELIDPTKTDPEAAPE